MKTARIFAALFVLLVSATAWAEEAMINNKEAKIRNGPGTNYTVLWKPRMYTPLEVLAKHGDWCAVRDVEGDVGWIHDSVLAKEPAAIVTDAMLNVHESADSNSRILYQAPKGYTLKALEDKGGWLKVVDPDGESGWISKKGIWTGTTEAQAKETKGSESKKGESKKEHKKGKKK